MRKRPQYLNSDELSKLEKSFREWIEKSGRTDVRKSRRRILIIFLLIRYTGAKLNEVLALVPLRDIDCKRQAVYIRNADNKDQSYREVIISETLSNELQSMLNNSDFIGTAKSLFDVDPAFVRRKFYERAQACGFDKKLGGPEMLRKSRAVELIDNNMPLPAVQKLLGHSTPNLTTSYISFSEEEIRQVTKHYIECESARKTSARNIFLGKITSINRGDIQTLLQLSTIENHRITAVITNDSLNRLGLIYGKMITAEVKAPYIIVQKMDDEPASSAENRFSGTVERIISGKVSTEYVVSISQGTRICSVITTESAKRLKLKPGDHVWALFNSFAVILHID